MDAVDLPLPAKVDFGKILTAVAEGVDGGGGGGGVGGGGGGGGEVLRRCSDADRRHGDVKQHIQNAESCPSYGSKRTSSEVSLQKSIPLGLKSESNVKRDFLGTDTVLSFPKQDGKMLSKKTIKLLSGPPCSKRPKLEPVHTARDAEAKGHDFISQKIVPDLMQCASSEKSRLLKQKRISDAKRIDKRNIRSGVRSKFDCFTSKAGLANFDSGFLGSSILGMHGLKSDIRDITSHMEDLSLSELLNGTYKYSSLGKEKGKKVLHAKDELLVSVRKAYTMLCEGDSSHGKDAGLILSPKLPSPNTSSCDGKDHCSDKSSSFIKDPSQTNVCNTTVYRPKDVLDRLALSQVQDLDSLLSSACESSVTVKPSMPSTTFHGASLPPFPWSHSQAYRPSVDYGKLASRSNSLWQWVRVSCNLTALDNEDLSIHKIDDLLQEMEMAKASPKDLNDKQPNLYCTESTSGSLLQNMNSRKIGSENGPQQLNSLDSGYSSDSFQKYDSEGSLLKTPQASPKVMCAADILCEMARSTEAWSAQGYSNGAIKWPKSPSEKAMKARKPSSPFGTAESSSGSRNSDATRSGNNQSMKKIVDRKNDSTRMNNPGKGTIRWPVPIEGGASPSRSERGVMLDSRQTNSNAGRHLSQASSQARLEKEYENQQKLRKATLTSSLGPTGDWNRERNRRM